jgi:RNA polymerase sigma factor (sigma-70 family)
VLNEGFLKVFTRLAQYDPTKSLKGWIRRILINTALDAHRKQQRYYCHRGLEGVQQQQVDPSALDQLSYQEIIATIQTLSPAYRAVFTLFVFDGFTHEEIAASLCISIGTSKSNLFRARAQLQKQLQLLNRLPGREKSKRVAAG